MAGQRQPLALLKASGQFTILNHELVIIPYLLLKLYASTCQKYRWRSVASGILVDHLKSSEHIHFGFPDFSNQCDEERRNLLTRRWACLIGSGSL